MTVQLAVVGAHLRGQPLNHQLLDLGAVFSRPALTAPIYRLFALANTSPPKPGMIRSSVGASIEVEIWELTAEASASLSQAFRRLFDRQYYPQLPAVRERISLRGNRARGLRRYHQLWRMAGVSRAIGQSLASRGRFVWRSRSPYETEDFLIVGLSAQTARRKSAGCRPFSFRNRRSPPQQYMMS